MKGQCPETFPGLGILYWVRLLTTCLVLHSICLAPLNTGNFSKIMVLPSGQTLQSLELLPGASYSDTKVFFGHRKQLSLTKALMSE